MTQLLDNQLQKPREAPAGLGEPGQLLLVGVLFGAGVGFLVVGGLDLTGVPSTGALVLMLWGVGISLLSVLLGLALQRRNRKASRRPGPWLGLAGTDCSGQPLRIMMLVGALVGIAVVLGFLLGADQAIPG